MLCITNGGIVENVRTTERGKKMITATRTTWEEAEALQKNGEAAGMKSMIIPTEVKFEDGSKGFVYRVVLTR